MSMLLVPRSTTLVSDPVRRSRWKCSDRSWMWRNTCPTVAAPHPARPFRTGRCANCRTARRRSAPWRSPRPARRRRANGGGVGGHAVDHRLVGERHQQDRGLAGEDQQHGGDDARLQLGLALRPQHRQEAPQRREAGVRLGCSLFCCVRHRAQGRSGVGDSNRCGETLEPRGKLVVHPTQQKEYQNGSGYFVIAILGCADGGSSCTPVATLRPAMRPPAQCSAATGRRWRENIISISRPGRALPRHRHALRRGGTRAAPSRPARRG